MKIDEQEALLCTLFMRLDKDLEVIKKMLAMVRGGKRIDDESLLMIYKKYAKDKG
jgi:hypothetical protein